MLLGCIADDFTGAADIANTLSLGGMRTLLFVGIPSGDLSRRNLDAEAGVVALKTRSTSARDAVENSLCALAWLRTRGCGQFIFKYCSTFDSTPDGNIGPVATALARALDTKGVVVCPAFPTQGRTLYQGHLFVKDRLLSECGMERHPLTPMTDPDIRRWLALQCDCRIGHVGLETVRAGVSSLRRAIAERGDTGDLLVIVDAVSDVDLRTIGEALSAAVLLTGGSGIAVGLPENFRRAGSLSGTVPPIAAVPGRAVVLSGSCSATTRAQVRHHAENHPALAIHSDALIQDRHVVEKAAAFIDDHAEEEPLIYSSAEPSVVGAAQDRFGRDAVTHATERFFGEVARRAITAGARRLVIAGGETSGAVVTALGLQSFTIGREISPGVPALLSELNELRLAIALKSGNFGDTGFFSKAVAVLGGELA